MSFFSGRRQAELPPAPPQTGERKQGVTVSAQQPVGFETVLGSNSVLEGHLHSSANVRLDGTFTGTLEITGNVLIGETARIQADVNARNISIAGAVRGNVSGKKVQILRTGRVWGDIHAQALTTEEGAFIDGKITMTRQDVTDETHPDVSAPAMDDILPTDTPETAVSSTSLPAEPEDNTLDEVSEENEPDADESSEGTNAES